MAGRFGDGELKVSDLQAWLCGGHIVYSPGEFLLMGKIYEAAGCEGFKRGGAGARSAYEEVKEWMLVNFNTRATSRRNQNGFADVAIE
jgi:hypothetical protein